MHGCSNFVPENHVLYENKYCVTGRWRSIRNRYESTMSLLREARSGSIAAEHRHNFASRRRFTEQGKSCKHPKLSSWTHKFICLAYTNQEKPCSSTAEKNELTLAGLGEKKITIPDIDCSSQEFQDSIIAAFPKLGAGGGYEFLKCTPSTRKLEVIPYAISSCARRLKAWIGTANIYLRPIQINLDLSTSNEFDNDEVSIYNIAILIKYEKWHMYIMSHYSSLCSTCISL